MKLFELQAVQPGTSLRFPLPEGREGFALRTRDGAVRAYVNVCPHRAQPVDAGDGQLFLPDGSIECTAHGARFDPLTGDCLGGPCRFGLQAVDFVERDGAAWGQELSSET